MRNKPIKVTHHKENPKRTKAKAKRGYGLGAIPEDMSVEKWCQKHDPLFHVKGKERYRRLHDK